MAAFLAKRIVDGFLTFAQVPESLKDAVRECLEAEGRGDLAVEEAQKGE
mgnify:CR=1 FL=1